MSWWKTAKVGDRVTRVDDDDWVKVGGDGTALTGGPQFGEVYTITRVYIGKDLPPDYNVCLYLEGFGRRGFIAASFRPVQPNEKGMEILRGILKSAPVKITEKA